MLRLITKEFVVDAPIESVWQHLIRVCEWTSWAKHIRSVKLEPAGDLGPDSVGTFRLRNGIKSSFRVIDFEPGKRWLWRGAFLWLTIDYDHKFEDLGDGRTKLVWTVDAKGFGSATLGRLFAAIYRRNLAVAVPLLVTEMTGQQTDGG